MNKNTSSTRYYSNQQEEYISKKFEGYRTPNSGGGKFSKADIVLPKASMLLECKTSMSEKKSFTIQKDWIDKNKKEALENHIYNSGIAISFDPSGKENYYLIDEKLFTFLIENLELDLKNS